MVLLVSLIAFIYNWKNSSGNHKFFGRSWMLKTKTFTLKPTMNILKQCQLVIKAFFIHKMENLVFFKNFIDSVIFIVQILIHKIIHYIRRSSHPTTYIVFWWIQNHHLHLVMTLFFAVSDTESYLILDLI